MAEGNRGRLYHEVQESKLCGVHCLNAVLQGPYFSEFDLAAIAQELDHKEQQVMLESGATSSHYLRFMEEGSSNVAADGNFSIQVLNRALEVWNLQCVSMESPEAEEARVHPQDQNAFICHLQGHWFTIRRIGSDWFNFNSLYPAPEHLSNFYLAAYLDSLKSSGWSIFLVKGVLPIRSSASVLESGPSFGQWLTAEEADRITKSAKKVENTKIGHSMLVSALAASMPSAPFEPVSRNFSMDHDPEFAAALAASLKDVPSLPECSFENDLDCDSAISASIAQTQAQETGSPTNAAFLAQALAEAMFAAASSAGISLSSFGPQSSRRSP